MRKIRRVNRTKIAPENIGDYPIGSPESKASVRRKIEVTSRQPPLAVTFIRPAGNGSGEMCESQRCACGGKIYNRLAGESLTDFAQRVHGLEPGKLIVMEPVLGGYVPQIEANPFSDDPDAEMVKRMKPRELFAYMFEKMAVKG